MRIDRDIPAPMRDGVVLRGDLHRPAASKPRPVLICRTPYGKAADADEQRFAQAAVARGYAVLIQDVRGRHASDGDFEPHRNEGRDGCDTIEWAAGQHWCDGRVGTFGLSYAGCAQWLAAVEPPPHLLALAPAMSYARLRDCIYYGGAFDGDWVGWAALAIAPNLRARKGLPGPKTPAEAWEDWRRRGAGHFQDGLPIGGPTELREAAPFLSQWLAHPPHAPWWDFGDVADRLHRVRAAVLHLDGWHDDACGPAGAIENHQRLCALRAETPDARSMLVLGPWGHGVPAVTGQAPRGHRDFGPHARIDYDGLVLDFMDRHVRGLPNALQHAAPVRYFLMGANVWREAAAWPPPGGGTVTLHFAPGAGDRGALSPSAPREDAVACFRNDPRDPLREPEAWGLGPEDQRSLAETPDDRRLVFESAPLEDDLDVAGVIRAELYVSADAPDVDIYLKLHDVGPDGAAYPLMDTGAEVQRVSLRGATRQGGAPRVLRPGEVARLDLDRLLTANRFKKGHSIRAVLCASWHPGMSRNLQTGAGEAESGATRPARIALGLGPARPSRLILPISAPHHQPQEDQ